MNDLSVHLLRHPLPDEPIADVPAWWSVHQRAAAAFSDTIDRAVAGGLAADRPAWAFASGYQEALRHLVSAAATGRTALCVTEAGGNHPRAIATRLEPDADGFVLTGSKAFVTLGTFAERLLVAATTGEGDDGRPRIALAWVPATRAGVSVEALPRTPFVPEIPHARVTFEGVRVDAGERLPGDGWSDYVKPFRTVEDLHVFAAVLGWTVRVARGGGFNDATTGRLVALVAAARAVAGGDPASPATHVALAGVLDLARRELDALDWSATPVAALWQRDRALLEVAGKARARRLEVAWKALRG